MSVETDKLLDRIPMDQLQKLYNINLNKNEAVKKQHYVTAANLRDDEMEILHKYGIPYHVMNKDYGHKYIQEYIVSRRCNKINEILNV